MAEQQNRVLGDGARGPVEDYRNLSVVAAEQGTEVTDEQAADAVVQVEDAEGGPDAEVAALAPEQGVETAQAGTKRR